MKRIFLIFLLLIPISLKSYSQFARGQMKEYFFEAEMFILYEEYEDALDLYTRLNRIDPGNSNYKYRIGQCLLNITGRKREAIQFLEAATKDINPSYKEGRFREKKAPYESYYYLANAYRINNQLEKALATYEIFKKNLDTKIYDTTVVNQQIISCLNAIELIKVPIYVKRSNLGPVINDQYADMNPVISGDENVIIYNKLTPFQDALMFSRKVNGTWTEPENIIPYLGLGQEEGNYATSLSPGGDELYIYRRGADYDGNIFVTRRTGNSWSNIVKLNDNINSKFWESHATISNDGRKLFFTSNRKDSYGGLDIYVSEKDSTGSWGPAQNLGPVINSDQNEESPFLGKDDRTLFFSSRGHFNIGGYDIFYSTMLENGQWSPPLNLGYPLNTTDDDIFFYPVNDGFKAYYSISDTSGYGLSDIYAVEIFNRDHPRKFFVRGVVQIKDLVSFFGDSVKVSAINREDPDATVVVYSDPESGLYKLQLPQGKYTLTFESKFAELVMKDLDLPLTHPSDSFLVPGTTMPKADFTAYLNVGDNKMISVASGDSIALNLAVEPKSILVVEHWLGDSLLSIQKYNTGDTAFVYKNVPAVGENRLVFHLTDRFGNTTSSEVTISRSKTVTPKPAVRPEYDRVIGSSQVDELAGMLRKRGSEDVDRLLDDSGLNTKKFSSVDDILSYLKEEAKKRNISPSELDKTALRIAVMDNVLSQAAVDLLATGTEGELRKLLEDLKIADSKITTWTDLQKYISDNTGGRILPDYLNSIAADIIEGKDPRISLIREKILAYSEGYGKGMILKNAVGEADKRGLANSGSWLSSLYDIAAEGGMKDVELARMLSVLTARPGTDKNNYLEKLAALAAEPLASWLRSADIEKLRIKTAEDLLLYLLRNTDKGAFDRESLFNALARMIASEDISKEIIASQVSVTERPRLFVIWIILGAGIAFIAFLVYRRRKKQKED